MIFDDVKNLGRYSQIPFMKEIQRFLATQDLLKIEAEETEILGRDLFVRLGNYETGPEDQKMFEAHQVYADLQLVISGVEMMGCFVGAKPDSTTQYDAKADIQFFQTPINYSKVIVSADFFTIFFPGELHRPGCIAGRDPQRVKKLVFKIRL